MPEMIPCLYAGSLPSEVREELSDWQSDLCFHGDGGCVFNIHPYDVDELKLFLTWMIAQGVWTKRDTELVSYSAYVEVNPDMSSYGEYQVWLRVTGHRTSLKVAMEGT